MSTNNLISIAFTDEEKQKIQECFSTLHQIFKDKLVNLTPEERKRYGRVGDVMEGWVNRAVNYMVQFPDLFPKFLNLEEIQKDYSSRESIKSPKADAESVFSILDDTALLLGFDLYANCMAYYRYIRTLAQENVPNAKTVYEDLSRQFPGR